MTPSGSRSLPALLHSAPTHATQASHSASGTAHGLAVVGAVVAVGGAVVVVVGGAAVVVGGVGVILVAEFATRMSLCGHTSLSTLFLTPRGRWSTGCIQVYELSGSDTKLLTESEKKHQIKCGTFGASSLSERNIAGTRHGLA